MNDPTTSLAPPIITAAPQSITICEGSSAVLTVTATGDNLTYRWFRNGQLLPGVTTNQLPLNNATPGFQDGTFTVAVSNQEDTVNTNNAPAQVTIRQGSRITVSATTTPVTCAGGTNGTVILSATGGTSEKQYQLNNQPFQASPTFTGLRSGEYTAVVRDAGGCTSQTTVSVTQPEAIRLDIRAVAAKCPGGTDGGIVSTATGGNGGFRYQIDGGPYQENGLFIDLRANSTHFVTATDRVGCTVNLNAFVGGPAPFDIQSALATNRCEGTPDGTVSLSVTGGTPPYQYQVANNPFQASNTFTNLGPNTYEFSIRDSIGCIAKKSLTVSQVARLKVTAAATVPAACCTCPTGTVILSTEGGVGANRQYTLVDGRPGQASNQFTGLAPGTYRFRVADEAGCLDSITTTVANESAIILSPSRLRDASCPGRSDGEATMQLTGGARPYTFYWQNEKKDTLSSRTETQTALAEGTYTVTAVDSNRCASTPATVAIRTVYPQPPTPTVTLNGSSLAVSDTAGIQWYYRTDTTAARPITAATLPTYTPIASGRYFVIVTRNGCPSLPSDPFEFILTAAPEPVTSLSLRVYPNPVSDKLQVEINQVERAAVRLQMVDVSGRNVTQRTVPAFTGKQQVEWTLPKLPAGQYLLKAQAGSRQSVLRVMVQ